ncbi:MAG: CARDB domain-containing protein [Candidatus Micrarchaeia archaeon]
MSGRLHLLQVLVFLFMLLSQAFPQAAYITNSSGHVWNVTASYTQKVYVDVLPDPATNPDFTIKICDVGKKYVAAVYAMNTSGTATYITISKDLTAGSSATLVNASVSAGGTCYMTPVDKFAFSQFKDFTRTPIIYVSAFPGRPYILYSNSIDGSNPSFAFLDYKNGTLRGTYSTTATYSHTTGNVTGSISAITFQTDAGTQVKSPSDPDWGISSSKGRALIVGLCSDDHGSSCCDAKIINSSSQLPVQLRFNETVNDQRAYTRYFVVNGIGTALCIGSNIVPTLGFSANPIYSGSSSVATITLTNTGNVPITTDFNLTLNITGPGGYVNSTSWIITENLLPGGSTTRSVTFSNTARSGSYIFTAHADRNNVLVECDENNIVSGTLVVNPVRTLYILIDNNKTNIFPYAGRPYNVTMYINDSDGNIYPSPVLIITEINGLNPFTPTQIWNSSGTLIGVSSTVRGTITGNTSGYAKLVIAPTCNKLYNDPVRGPILSSRIGNYSMYVTTPVTVYYNGSFTTTVPLLVSDKSCADPGWVNSKEIQSKDYVLPVFDWLYEMFSITKKLVAP